MAYFAISYGSLVLLLNRKGMIMSVLTLSSNIQAFPFIMPIGCGCCSFMMIENTSLDWLFYLRLQMLPLLQVMPDTLLMKVHPFVRQNSLKMRICIFHLLLTHPDEYRRMLRR